MKTVTVTREELASAITEWDRQARKKPNDFVGKWTKKMTPKQYGNAVAPFLFKLLQEASRG